jgi:SAM-dependent MidA family methyltransferase
MSPAAAQLEQEIRRRGPISFRRFMEVALYHPEHGYYRRPGDPFGREGDYFTAEQLQPVFGALIARLILSLYRQMEAPDDFVVVELGAGRGEMAAALSRFTYLPVEVGSGELPQQICGVVFSNEFFDALPVERVVVRGGALILQRVDWKDGRFVWVDGEEAAEEIESYVRRYFPPLEDGCAAEISLDALRRLERIAAAIRTGYHFTIDYGYTRIEARRFPAGTLMSYRKHVASEDVLANPGERDLTAHVNFSALQEHGASLGLETVRFETLARMLLAQGESDHFQEILAADTSTEELARRLQLKTLLFSMGESFRSLLQKKSAARG